MSRVLVIGYGEIGRAIATVESKAGNEVKVRDPGKRKFASFVKKVDRIHICIPYNSKFVETVQSYIDKYEHRLCIVHSTVPPGTMSQLNSMDMLVHSPVIGVHPDLVKSLVVFKKFLGGPQGDCTEAARVLKDLWMDPVYLGPFETTELAKILSTTYYGWNIAYAAKVKELCTKYGQDFDNVYTRWNKEYNRGYREMSKHNVIRPVLYPPEGGLGGHCVYENAVLLNEPELTNPIIKLGKKQEGDNRR